MKRPRIIVLSDDNDADFKFCSDGWFTITQRRSPEARALFALVKACVHDSKSVPDAIEILEAAGFEVEGDEQTERPAPLHGMREASPALPNNTRLSVPIFAPDRSSLNANANLETAILKSQPLVFDRRDPMNVVM